MADDSYTTLKMDILSKADNVRETFLEGMTEFMGIWERLGVSEAKCQSRIEDMVKHYVKLNEFMIKEERETEEQILDGLAKYEEQLIQLCAELSLDPSLYELDRSLKILAFHEAAKEQVLQLSEMREVRMFRLKTLHQEESPLSRRLCCPLYPKFDRTVPSEEYLHEFENNVKWLRQEESSRRDVFLKTRKTIVVSLGDLEAVPTNTFERQVVLEPEQEFILSVKNMEALEIYKNNVNTQLLKAKEDLSNMMQKVQALWERLSISKVEQEYFHVTLGGTTNHKLKLLEKEIVRCETLRRENLGKSIATLRGEIGNLQDQCRLSEEERSDFAAMFSDDYTEELLSKHEVEAERLKEYYDRIQDIISLVEDHKKKFECFVELEKKENDPIRLKNRGGLLLLETKKRAQLKKVLPDLEKVIETRVAQWEASNGGRKFRLDGVDVVEAIEQKWTDYYNERENEKLEKQKARAQKLEEEVQNGTKPLVPTLKRSASNVSRTPSKLRKGINGSIVSRRKSGAGKPSVLLKAKRRSSRNKSGSPNSTLGTTLSSYGEFMENINRKAEREQCRSSILISKTKTPKSRPFIA